LIWTTNIQQLMVGLVKIGIPYRFAFGVFTALRFLPIIQREVAAVKAAHSIRGHTKASQLGRRFQLWRPADLDKIEQGLQALGIRLRKGKFALKESEPKKWRQYLLGVWSRNQGKPGVAALYQSKLWIARDMLQTWVKQNPEWKLPVTFDSWYTQPAFCRFLDKELGLPYVGTLSINDQVVLPEGSVTLEQFAKDLKQKHQAAIKSGGKPLFHKIGITYKGEKETYYSYCRTLRIHNYGKQLSWPKNVIHAGISGSARIAQKYYSS